MKSGKPTISIYTDGASSGNPGRGGFGVVMLYGSYRKEISCGYRRTTNNRMELLAVIVALEALKIDGSTVTIYTDSRYVSDAINKHWILNWQKKNFNKVKNPDLWQRFLAVYRRHHVTIEWVKGHDVNVENNRCDQLAVAASQGADLQVDEYYEEVGNEKLEMRNEE